MSKIKINTKPRSAQDTKTKVPAGFTMVFSNGNTISIQFGWGNYSTNRDESVSETTTAEVAIWNDKGNWYEFPDTPDSIKDSVKGYCTTDEVAQWIHFAANNVFE